MSLIILISIAIVISLPASAVEQNNQRTHNTQLIIDEELNFFSLFQNENNAAEDVVTHDVQAGDSLKEIANEYNVRIEDLTAVNALTSDVITRDQQLVIPNIDVPEPTPVKTEQATAKKQEQADPQQDEVQKARTQENKAQQEQDKTPEKNKQESAETLTMVATAYTAECAGCSGITSTGINLNEDRDKKVIAVDPNVIPLGTKVHVEGYGTAIAGDIGGAIKGNKIDLHVPTTEIALQWGVREVEVTILS